MMTHKVSEYFGEIIEVEKFNKEAAQISTTHYGDIPWSKDPLLFATRVEKYECFVSGKQPKLTVRTPAWTMPSKYDRMKWLHGQRIFLITPFRACSIPPTDGKKDK